MLDFKERKPSKEELLALLKTDDPEVLQSLFRAARETRKEIQGDKILRMDLYISPPIAETTATSVTIEDRMTLNGTERRRKKFWQPLRL